MHMQIKLKYNKMNKRFETIEEMLDMKNMFVSLGPVEDKLENYIGKPIWWKTDDKEYDYCVEFVGDYVEDGILYDKDGDRWVDLEYAQDNVIRKEGSDEF